MEKDLERWPFKVVSGPKDEVLIEVTKGKSQSLTPEDILAIMIRKMKEMAEQYLDRLVTKVVISVPAMYTYWQIQATKKVCESVGLTVLRAINESTAAVMQYALDHQKSKKEVLVFDLGGGTFSVTLIEIAENFIDAKATIGDNHFGGVDFDD